MHGLSSFPTLSLSPSTRRRSLLRADPNATSSRRRDQTQMGHAVPIATSGVIANIGVHGTKVDLHLESLWDRNITITTRLVDTVSTPMLLKSLGSKKIDPKLLITHRFKLDRILDAYDTFGHAAKTKALKVIIEA